MNPNFHDAFEADLKAFLDGELPFFQKLKMRHHLRNCPQCREEIQIMQTIEAELKTEETAPLEADLRAKILGNLPVETPQSELLKRAPKSKSRLTPQLVFGAGSLAVLAAVVFMPTFGRPRENARHSTAQSDLSQLEIQEAQNAPAPVAAPGIDAIAGAAGEQKIAQSSNKPSSEIDNITRNRVTYRRNPAPGFSDGPLSPSTPQSGASFQRGAGSGGYEFAPPQRAVHKQGSLTVAVDDAEAKGSAVEILVKNVGGFVANNALSTGSDGRKTATLDLRVPVGDFESVVGKIGKLGMVREKSVNGEDITQRLTQSAAQQKSLQNELSIREAQLRAANPKKADARRSIVADVRQLRFQANQARAQLEYLRKYAALSTLFVTLQDKPKTVTPAGWTGSLGQTGREAWNSFLVTAKWPLAVVIWILAYAPLWLPALLIWRRFGRKLLTQ
ncbi:MAG TPA: DUF4349 domain-containing protein [Abditibacterium sp.]|jgi:hypothetical protein